MNLPLLPSRRSKRLTATSNCLVVVMNRFLELTHFNLNAMNYRQPSRREIWDGINEADKFYTCCLCGEVIGKEDFEPQYVGGFHAHSGCWQENANLGNRLSLIQSRMMVDRNYKNEGTFYEVPSNVQKPSILHSIYHETAERQAKIQNELK